MTLVRYSYYILLVVIVIIVGEHRVLAQTENTGLYYANEQLVDTAKEDQAFDLMLKLRCVQCQGQSIADSDAPIAEAMRHQVRLQIESGKNSDEIKNWMTKRYGDYVSFDPPTSGISILLWSAPVIIFLLAIFLVVPLFRAPKPAHLNKGDDA